MQSDKTDRVIWPQSHLLLAADVHINKRQGVPLDNDALDKSYGFMKDMAAKKGLVTLGLEHHEVCGCDAHVWVIRTTIRVA